MRRIPDERNRVDWAVYQTDRSKQLILTAGAPNPSNACDMAATACRAAAADCETEPAKPRWRIRPGKANTANTEQAESAAMKWNAIADEYSKVTALIEQAHALAGELSTRARELAAEPEREKLYASDNVTVDWRGGDTAFINDVAVAMRNRRTRVGMFDRATERMQWLSATEEPGPLFSIETIIRDAFSRRALEPLPAGVEYPNL